MATMLGMAYLSSKRPMLWVARGFCCGFGARDSISSPYFQKYQSKNKVILIIILLSGEGNTENFRKVIEWKGWKIFGENKIAPLKQKQCQRDDPWGRLIVASKKRRILNETCPRLKKGGIPKGVHPVYAGRIAAESRPKMPRIGKRKRENMLKD